MSAELHFDMMSLMQADSEGMIDRRPEVVVPAKDVVISDPLMVAGDEGMYDQRELRAQQEVIISANV